MMDLSGFVDADMLRTTLVVATPLLLAALGELLLERVGLLNLAIEGMVATGASVAFAVVYLAGSSAPGIVGAVAAAAVSGVLIGLVYGWLTLGLQANQITVGLALLIFGLGAASLLYRGVVGITTTPPSIGTLPVWRIPLLSDIPYVGRVLFQHDPFVYLGLLVIVPVWWLLYRTPLGLRLRATGESPKAVDSLGLPLLSLRFSGLVVGSALIGIAGAFFPLSLVGGYSDNIASGRGWLALMLVIFGRWRPWTIMAGALLFAWVEALQFQFGVTTKAIPPQFLRMLPYVLAIIVLVRVYGKAQAPAALTKPYDREARF
jgi:ABC-type uncharacterized transport system permease subunit